MAATLGRAVIDWIADNVSTLSGKSWYGEAPAGTGVPALIVKYSVQQEQRTSGTAAIEQGTLGCDVYASSAASAKSLSESVLNELTDRNNWSMLSVTGARVLHLLRAQVDLIPEPQRLESGVLVFHCEFSLNAMLQITVR